MSATKPWVDAFADEMERKLAANRHKGDRSGWAELSPQELLTMLLREVSELSEAFNDMDDSPTGYPPAREAVLGECADIANFAMMIADVAGGMRPKEGTPHV